MNGLEKAMQDIFDGCASTSDEKVRAHCVKQLDHCQRVLAELQQPKYRAFVQFALLWRDMEAKLEEVCRVVNVHSPEKVDPLNELLAELMKSERS
jgi:hypothetical protein